MTRSNKKKRALRPAPPSQEREEPLDEKAIEQKFKETTLNESVDSIAQLLVEMGEKGLMPGNSTVPPTGERDWLKRKMPDMIPYFARVLAATRGTSLSPFFDGAPEDGTGSKSNAESTNPVKDKGGSESLKKPALDPKKDDREAPSSDKAPSDRPIAPLPIDSKKATNNGTKVGSSNRTIAPLPVDSKKTATTSPDLSAKNGSSPSSAKTTSTNGLKRSDSGAATARTNGKARSIGASHPDSSFALDEARKRIQASSGRPWGPSKYVGFSKAPHKKLDKSEVYKCEHTDLDPKKMKRVGELFSLLFASSLRLYMPIAFQGVVENLHEYIIKDRISDCLESGVDPLQLPMLLRTKGVRQSIKKELEYACEGDLVSIALQLSSENVYDLVLDMADQHGRDVYNDGAPCACYFAHCMTCFEHLVEDHVKFSSHSADDMAKAMVRAQEDVAAGVEALFASNQKQVAKRSGHGAKRSDVLLETFSEAWKTLTEILWDTAKSIVPMAGTRVQQANDALEKSNGIHLWYSVVIREIKDSYPDTPCRGKPQVFPPIIADKKGQESSTDAYDMSKEEIERITRLGEIAKQDPTGVQQLKGVAQHAREKGNYAFEKSRYEQAAAFYTVAINYDKREAIYPLNRAACNIKLGKYIEAERDCSVALLVDIRNAKAWYRRGVSRAKQGKMEQARNDFEHTLFLCKDNKAAFDENMRLCTEHMDSLARSKGIGKDKVPRLEPRQWKPKGKSAAAKPAEAPKSTKPPLGTGMTSTNLTFVGGSFANAGVTVEDIEIGGPGGPIARSINIPTRGTNGRTGASSSQEGMIISGSSSGIAGPSQPPATRATSKPASPRTESTNGKKIKPASAFPATDLSVKKISAANKEALRRISRKDWNYGLRVIEVFTQTCFAMAFSSLVRTLTGVDVDVPLDARFKGYAVPFAGDKKHTVIMKAGLNLDEVAAKYGKFVDARDASPK